MNKTAITLRKGGSSKSTSAIELGASLSKLGAKVLIIDTDFDGQIASFLGIAPQYTLSDALRGSQSVKEAIIKTKWGFDIIASDSDLIMIESKLRKRNKLKSLLNPINTYNHILVDCSPNYSMILANVLDYVDDIIVPVELSPSNRDRLANIYKELNEARITNPDLTIKGILPVKFRARENSQQVHLEQLKKDFKDIYEPIPHSCIFEKAQLLGVPATIKYPKHKAIKPYMNLAKQIKEE